MPSIVLASTSPFRAELLARLAFPFKQAAPEVDESRANDEAAEDLVRRLAIAKARAVAGAHPDALIIGSDQVAVLDDKILGKPGSHKRAIDQLRTSSGRTVRFLTGLCLLDAARDQLDVDVIPFEVTFRELTDRQIEYYLKTEQPYNAAGSFKSEALGAALFQSMNGDDPTALIGLPLIRLTEMLANAGFDVLSDC